MRPVIRIYRYLLAAVILITGLLWGVVRLAPEERWWPPRGGWLDEPQETSPTLTQARLSAYYARHPSALHPVPPVSPPVEVARGTLSFPPDLLARRRHMTSMVVQAVVDTSGQVIDPVILRSSHPALDTYALSFVRTLRYTPGTRDGIPVPCFLTVTVRSH